MARRQSVKPREPSSEELDLRNIINDELDEIDGYSRTFNQTDARETLTPRNRMKTRTKTAKNKGWG